MHTRLTRFAGIVTALVALAIGGSAFALASGASHAKSSPALRKHRTAGSHAAVRQHRAAGSHAAVRQHVRASVSRKSSEDPSAKEEQGENETSSEPDNDAAAQAAACQKAGIDPNADNVQYDDQTGVCSLDTGSNNGP